MSLLGARIHEQSIKRRYRSRMRIWMEKRERRHHFWGGPAECAGRRGGFWRGISSDLGKELGKGSGQETRAGQELTELESESSTPAPMLESWGGGSLRAFRRAKVMRDDCTCCVGRCLRYMIFGKKIDPEMYQNRCQNLSKCCGNLSKIDPNSVPNREKYSSKSSIKF